MISFRADDALVQRLDGMASQSEETRAEMLDRAVRLGLDSIEQTRRTMGRGPLRLLWRLMADEQLATLIHSLVGDEVSSDEVRERSKRIRKIMNDEKRTGEGRPVQ